jgi:hypothetical protein
MPAFDPEYVAAIEREQQRLIQEAIAEARETATKRHRTSDIDMLYRALQHILGRERPIVEIERRERALLDSDLASVQRLDEIEASA